MISPYRSEDEGILNSPMPLIIWLLNHPCMYVERKAVVSYGPKPARKWDGGREGDIGRTHSFSFLVCNTSSEISIRIRAQIQQYLKMGGGGV